MALNTKVFNERVGQIKLLSIILAVIGVILTAENWTGATEEKAFWWSFVVCMAISVILFVFCIFGLMENDLFGKLDKLFHALGSILMIIVACFFIYNVHEYRNSPLLNYERRAAAGAFGLVYGIVLAYIGWFIFQ